MVGPSIIILSQHDLLHRNMQESLDLLAIAQMSRRNLVENKKKTDRQAKLPKEISNPWQTLLATIWSK